MGEMMIKGLDEALLRELKAQAELHGIDPEAYATDLLRQSVVLRRGNRSKVAREVLASQTKKADTDSVVFLREDRARS